MSREGRRALDAKQSRPHVRHPYDVAFRGLAVEVVHRQQRAREPLIGHVEDLSPKVVEDGDCCRATPPVVGELVNQLTPVLSRPLERSRLVSLVAHAAHFLGEGGGGAAARLDIFQRRLKTWPWRTGLS